MMRRICTSRWVCRRCAETSMGCFDQLTTYPILTDELVKKLVFATLDEDQQKILMKDKEFDYSFAFGDLGRFRERVP